MAPINLTKEQADNWKLLLAEIYRKNAQNNLESMQKIMRWFAIMMASQQANLFKIVTGKDKSKTAYINFPTREFATKQNYLNYHAQDGVWGEDPLMMAVFDALGYQVKVQLANTGMSSYIVLENPNSGIEAQVVNYGAQIGGTHWEMAGEANPGAGNCMYYTMAQIVQRDLPRITQCVQVDAIKPPIQETSQALIQKALQPLPIAQVAKSVEKKPAATNEKANENTVKPSSKVAPVAKVTKVNPVVKPVVEKIDQHVVAQFEQLDQAAEQRYIKAKQILEKYSAQELARIYALAMKKENRTDNDSYLEKRPSYIVNELQEMGWGGDINDLLQGGFAPQAEIFDSIIREQFVHMLAKEIWRNSDIYPLLLKLPTLMQPSKHAQNDVEQEPTVRISQAVR